MQKIILKYYILVVVNTNSNIDMIISPKIKIWFELTKMYTPCNGFSKGRIEAWLCRRRFGSRQLFQRRLGVRLRVYMPFKA